MAAENMVRRKKEGSLSAKGTAVGMIACSNVVTGIIRNRFDLRAWKNFRMSFMRSMSIVATRNIASSIETLVGLLMSMPAPKLLCVIGHKSWTLPPPM